MREALRAGDGALHRRLLSVRKEAGLPEEVSPAAGVRCGRVDGRGRTAASAMGLTLGDDMSRCCLRQVHEDDAHADEVSRAARRADRPSGVDVSPGRGGGSGGDRRPGVG
ncbi:hypothetical protein [Rhodococcus sp. T2V]|uniref:hypothetical protein n=1 Tax=Rhodococcus sp. T2V TaxID=3034164 RepID=UPI0031FF179F